MSGLLHDLRRAALLGIAGPVIFLTGVVLVSWSERDFMTELGWDQWPSGTALGPHGWATVLTFLLTGAFQVAFGSALIARSKDKRVRQIGGALLVLSGLGMITLAFKTDPEGSDQTWHGALHVIGYFTFFFSLLLAYVFLIWGSWGWLNRSSCKYAPFAFAPWLGAFLLPHGLARSNYLFFAILFTPLLILAIRLAASDEEVTQPHRSGHGSCSAGRATTPHCMAVARSPGRPSRAASAT